MTEQDELLEATRIVDARIGFIVHLIVFLLVNAGLLAINLRNSPDRLWIVWPAAGWGVGVLCHGLAVFMLPREGSIRRRMIAKRLERKARRDAARANS